MLIGLLFWVGGKYFSSNLLYMLSGVGFLAALFCAYFFRDPPRAIPPGQRVVLCPADGKILEIVETKDPISPDPVTIVRIFLSIFNAHLQRAPMAGTVVKVKYKKGRFLDARDPKAPFENEQNRIEIETHGSDPKGSDPQVLAVIQIAGLIARRIVCWVKEGQKVEAGERIGLIRFGSQVDVVMPKNARLRVQAGDFVTAGDTVLADLT